MVYSAFGLTWDIPFNCPEMGTPSHQTAIETDVIVSLGTVPKSLENSVSAGPFQQVTPDSVMFSFPNVARYLILQGSQIIISPEADAQDNQIRLFLLGTAVSLLLHQRGILPLHASGIRTPKGAVLFTGHSGFGKSTLLATFLARGYAMLTDDLAAISVEEGKRPYVSPGYPRYKLWADSAEKLNRSTDGLNRIRSDFEKYSVPADEVLNESPSPLHAVYALTPGNEQTLRLEPLRDASKFNIFLDHTWQKLALKRMNRHAEHFRQAVAIANQIQIRRVYRPEKPFLPHALADLIEDDFLS